MYSTWIQSTEEYKGFTLEIIMTRYAKGCPHRSCRISRNGEVLGLGKTKKEMKDLIDHSVYKAD